MVGVMGDSAGGGTITVARVGVVGAGCRLHGWRARGVTRRCDSNRVDRVPVVRREVMVGLTERPVLVEDRAGRGVRDRLGIVNDGRLVDTTCKDRPWLRDWHAHE